MKLGATWGFGYTPVTYEAVGTESDRGSTDDVGEKAEFTSNGGNYFGPGTVGPMRANLRASASTYFDVGVDPGLVQTVLNMRFGQLDSRNELPWAVQLEWRGPGLINDLNRRTNVGAARIELYPHALDRPLLDAYLVAALGVSTGQQYLGTTNVPSDYDTSETEPFLEAIVNETRLEAWFGAHYRLGHGTLTVALAPYIVIDRRGLSAANCNGCNLDVIDARHDFGLILLLAPGAALEKHH